MGTITIKIAFVLASALLLAPCLAVQFTNTEFNILQDKPFTLQWEDAKGPVEISLVKGESSNIETVQVIDTGDTGNSYTWTPPSLLLAGTYAFAITDGDSTNYSPQWDYDYADNLPASTRTSSPAPVSTSTRTTTTTSVPTTQPPTTTTVTTSPKATTSSVPAPNPTTTTSSSANDSGDISSSSRPTSSTTSSTTIASTSPGPSGSEPAHPGSSSSSSSSPNSSSSSSSSTGTQQTSSSGLSTGAKVGIGVGAGLGGLGVLSAALLLVFRRGKAAGRRAVDARDAYTQESKAELGSDARPVPELGGQGLAEMQSGHDGWRGQPSELDASPYSYRGADMTKTWNTGGGR
ncbi:hypothetical protein F4859DRAFT_386609 [Xylaria cf. heliscus]|nr:hypothetical protein F4859DRAFT_386609 [Xylaria cf. heliscus]